MRLERSQLIIGVVVVVVLGLAAWMFWPATPAPRTTAQTRARAGRPPAKAETLGPADAVRLDTLKASREDPGEAGRNPFRFQAKAAPPPPKVVATPVVSEPSGPALPPAKTGPPPPAPIGLKFVGLLERANGVKWAVLSDGKVVLYGKDGDIIDGKYLIVKIGTESIEMTYLDGRGRQVIRLTGQ
jgi:hypothetical protein